MSLESSSSSISEAARATVPRILPSSAVTRVEGSRALRAETRLLITPRQTARLRYLAEMSYPFEACGLLVGKLEEQRVRVEEVLQARNLTQHAARERYVLDPEDFLTAERCARERGLRIVGIWHSHPNHPAEPSVRDLKAAWHGYSYMIISVDALGDTVVRSWRLEGSHLAPEPIEISSPGRH